MVVGVSMTTAIVSPGGGNGDDDGCNGAGGGIEDIASFCDDELR